MPKMPAQSLSGSGILRHAVGSVPANISSSGDFAPATPLRALSRGPGPLPPSRGYGEARRSAFGAKAAVRAGSLLLAPRRHKLPPQPLHAQRLLLRQAVQGAESPDEIDGVDADHLAVRKQLGERVSATRSFGSLNVGTITTPLAM